MAGFKHGVRQGHCVEYRPPCNGKQIGSGCVDVKPAVGGFNKWLKRPSTVLCRREQYDWNIGPGPITRMSSTACSRNYADGGKGVNQTRNSEFE